MNEWIWRREGLFPLQMMPTNKCRSNPEFGNQYSKKPRNSSGPSGRKFGKDQDT